MKYLRLCSLLLMVSLLAGCDQAPTKEQGATKSTNAENESSQTNASSSDAPSGEYFVIDVRSKKEWDSGHLDSAIHIPHTEIVEGIAKVTDQKNAKIYVY